MSNVSPIVVPIFISNLGCPHRCVFCDQSQFSEPIPPEDVSGIVRNFVGFSRGAENRQKLIAFYGGSFTGLERSLLSSYLKVGSTLVKEGVVDGLKASTRPDMVTPDILDLLIEAGFVELELGVQSMDDKVLAMSARGHSASDSLDACALVKRSGLRLGVQIMPGLPGEDRLSFKRTVELVTSMKPDVARIYPTVVMRGTGLEKMFIKGRYAPLDLEEAILRSLHAYSMFTLSGIKVLRMGLPQSDKLDVVAGPYHPAFGFLVKSRAYRIMVQEMTRIYGEHIEVRVNPSSLPDLVGYRRSNMDFCNFTYKTDAALPKGSVAIDDTCLYLSDIIGRIL